MIPSKQLVSIIMPSFNAELFLEQAINSVVAQNYQNWELIIVDDGSNDNTIKIAGNYSRNDDRIKLFIRNRDPKGANSCRNIGLEKATGKYVIYFDADDLLLPFCLHQRVEKMEKRPFDHFAVFQQFSIADSIQNARIFTQLRKRNILYCIMATDNIWQTMGAIWRRDFLVKIGGFDESIHIFDDDVLHLNALLSKNVLFSLYPDLPADCYYRANYRNNSSDYYYTGSTAMYAIIERIAEEISGNIPNKTLLYRSVNSIFTKYFLYFLLSKSNETSKVYNLMEILSDKKLLKSKDIMYFTRLLSFKENNRYDNPKELSAINDILWHRFFRIASYIQYSPLNRKIRNLIKFCIRLIKHKIGVG